MNQTFFQIAPLINERTAIATGTFLVRPSSQGRCMFVGTVEDYLPVESVDHRDTDQFWISHVLIAPVKRYRADNGEFNGLRAGDMLLECPSFDGLTEIPTHAPESILSFAGLDKADVVAQLLNGEEILTGGTFLIRRGRRYDHTDVTIVAGVLLWPGPGVLPGNEFPHDEIWATRLVFMPLQRHRDDEGLFVGYDVNQILTSHADVKAMHRLD